MGKEITSHRDSGLNEQIFIFATDDPGPGGAHHNYDIKVGDVRTVTIPFQDGGVKDVGLNGISETSLLAIVADRLQSFQDGPYKNDFTQTMLDHVQGALQAAKDRTADRVNRNVEGHLKA